MEAFETVRRTGDAQPVLLDSNGTRYAAAGWIYKDLSVAKVRYDDIQRTAMVAATPAE